MDSFARVIPPLASVSPAGLLSALFSVSDAQFTSSTVPEAKPATYSSGTTYGLGVQVAVVAAGNGWNVYQSLQASNINHTPASSPTWWRFLGLTYGTYSTGQTYALNDRAIDVVTHLQYQSLAAGNLNNAFSDTTKWILEGPTNRWLAMDLLRSTKTVGPSPQTYVLTPGARIDAIGLAGLVADRFTITLKVAGTTLWTHTEMLTTRDTLNWSDYFLGSFINRDVTAVFDIPKYAGAEFTITFERDNGNVEVGGIWVNEAVILGILETDPGVDRRGFSTFDRDIGGEPILIRRARKPQNTWSIRCPKEQIKKVKGLPDLLDAVPAMWVGIEEVVDAYFDLVTLVAVYTRFTIIPGHPDVRLNIELEEA